MTLKRLQLSAGVCVCLCACIDERPTLDIESAAQVTALGCSGDDIFKPNHYAWDAERERFTVTVFQSPFAPCSQPTVTVQTVDDLVALVLEPGTECDAQETCADPWEAAIRVTYDGADRAQSAVQLTLGFAGEPDFSNVVSGVLPLGSDTYVSEMANVRSSRWAADGIVYAMIDLPGAAECFDVGANHGYDPAAPVARWHFATRPDAPETCPGTPETVESSADFSRATANTLQVVRFSNGTHQVEEISRVTDP